MCWIIVKRWWNSLRILHQIWAIDLYHFYGGFQLVFWLPTVLIYVLILFYHSFQIQSIFCVDCLLECAFLLPQVESGCFHMIYFLLLIAIFSFSIVPILIVPVPVVTPSTTGSYWSARAYGLTSVFWTYRLSAILDYRNKYQKFCFGFCFPSTFGS